MEKDKIVTIEEIDYDGDYLVLENVYSYKDEMFDGLDNFKQEDIKSGMLVETREGTKKIVVDTTKGIILKSEEGFMTLSDYKDFKLYIERPKYDIVKVGTTTSYGTSISNMDFDRVLWEEPIKIELTDKERKILEALDTLGFTHIVENEDSFIVTFIPNSDEGFARLPHFTRGDFSFMNEDSGEFNIKELLEC